MLHCEFDDTEPDEWEKGLGRFRPAPVFDVSQTEREPLPELETETTGNALVSRRALDRELLDETIKITYKEVKYGRQ